MSLPQDIRPYHALLKRWKINLSKCGKSRIFENDSNGKNVRLYLRKNRK
jgi:hypothetical protein